jgi:hypothetical protein
MKRRTLLQLLLSLIAAVPARLRLFAQTPALTALDQSRIRALADVVLPGELGVKGRAAAVDNFLRWVREYRAGADTDHGYGFTRLRRTPPSPAAKYPAQLDALDNLAKGRRFADLTVDERKAIVETALEEAKIDRLPARPDGGHIASDLMGFYFNSIEANDLCYRAAIGRDTCRGLERSENKPAALAGGR